MSEIVERFMEQMSVEFEQILRAGLLDENEIRLMSKKLREHENRINSYSCRITDFKDYIEYNCNVYRLVKTRRSRVKHTSNATAIMLAMIRRTLNLYDKAFIRYAGDKSLYLSYFDFCRNTNTHITYDICERMLQYHHDDVESWIIAAKWQYDTQKYNFAISLLQKALEFHPKCGDLYVDLVRYELVRTLGEVALLNGDVNEEDLVAFLKKISEYVQSMGTLVKDAEYFVRVLEQLEKYKVSETVQKEIIDLVGEKYVDTAELWQCLAQRERRGFHQAKVNEEVVKKTKIQLTIDKYEEGLRLLQGEEKEKLSVFYIRWLLDIKEEEYRACKIVKHSFLLSQFEKSQDFIVLSEKFYTTWLEQITEHDLGTKISTLATSKIPHSVELWKIRMKFALYAGKERTKVTFKNARDALGVEAAPIWITMLQYICLSAPKPEVINFFEDAIRQPPLVSQPFKHRYIDWLVINKGFEPTRTAFRRIAEIEPPSIEFYRSMVKHQKGELIPKYDKWIEVYEYGCRKFGTEHIEVWLNYLEFYLYHNKDPKASEDGYNDVYDRARRALPDFKLLEFNEKFDDLMKKFKSMTVKGNICGC